MLACCARAFAKSIRNTTMSDNACSPGSNSGIESRSRAGWTTSIYLHCRAGLQHKEHHPTGETARGATNKRDAALDEDTALGTSLGRGSACLRWPIECLWRYAFACHNNTTANCWANKAFQHVVSDKR